MEYIYIGKIVNTHGLKGEIRIISDFNEKEEVFKKEFKIYLGTNKEEKIIKNYRKHKNYDMVMLNEIDSIEKALNYKNTTVFVNREDIKKEIIIEDLLNYYVYEENKFIGKVTSLEKGVKYPYIVINNKYRVPYLKEFIKEIDKENTKVNIYYKEGLIDEN